MPSSNDDVSGNTDASFLRSMNAWVASADGRCLPYSMLQISHAMQAHNMQLIAIARTHGQGDENLSCGADSTPSFWFP
jgi:hypothetical protein